MVRVPLFLFFIFFPGSSYREFGVRLAPFQVINGGTRVKSVKCFTRKSSCLWERCLPVYTGVVDRGFLEQEAQSS